MDYCNVPVKEETKQVLDELLFNLKKQKKARSYDDLINILVKKYRG